MTLENRPGNTATLAPELPAQITLESLNDARLRVKEPIAVAVFAEGGQVIAEAAGLDEFGSGDDLAAAIADLQCALVDLYFTLAAEQDHLGKGLRQVWATLQVKVAREFDRVVGKFGMEITEGGRHRKAKFYYQGELIISTLRSRSPQEFESHQVRRQLKLNGQQLRAAIRCTLGLDDYIAILKERGLI